MPRKPTEIVTETYKVNSISVHNAETHGGVLLKVENPAEGAEEYLMVDDAKFYVPGDKKVNLWKLLQWFRTSKDVSVEVDRLPKKYMKIKEARFSVPSAPQEERSDCPFDHTPNQETADAIEEADALSGEDIDEDEED